MKQTSEDEADIEILIEEEYDEHQGRSVRDIMNVQAMHEKGIKGKGIKIAILDSGLGVEY